MKLHVVGVGLVDFDGLTVQSVPAIKLCVYHAPNLLLTGKFGEATITVKLKDIDFTNLQQAWMR